MLFPGKPTTMAIVTIAGLPVFQATVDEAGTGMFRISLVDDPAVQSNFLAFDAKRRVPMYAVSDEERRLVLGVVMRADFPIFRADAGFGEYYIIYKADQIRAMAERYLLEGRQNAVNLMHRDGTDVDGVQMVQYFIKGKGINPDGFDEIADGSLFAEYHVVNDEVWAEIKAGTYKGFSLEGVFDLVPEEDVDRVRDIVDTLDGKFSNQYDNMSKLQRIKSALARLLAAEFGNVTTDKGVLAWDGEEDLKAGDKVFIEDQEGERTPAESGNYVTLDGKTIIVVDGEVSEIIDPEAEVAPEVEPETVESEFARKATDKGDILWEGEEDLKEGDRVFVEVEGETVPAPDGEYVTEDGKTIVVAEGVVAEIRDEKAEATPEPEQVPDPELETLRRENQELRERIAALEAAPAAKPAHEEVKAAAETGKTGVKGLDRFARFVAAKQ